MQKGRPLLSPRLPFLQRGLPSSPPPRPVPRAPVPRESSTLYLRVPLVHRRALALLMLTCVGVANSSMNPDPEPVHAGPIQVFIMAGQPACVQVPYLSIWCPSHHSKWVDSLPPHTTAWLPGGADSACCWLRLRECVLGRVGGHENKSLIPRLSTRRPVQHGGVRLGSMVKKCPIGRGRGVVVPPPPNPSPACASSGRATLMRL